MSERYRLLRLIDVGGMGEVWAARNELTHRKFAIKFLLPDLAKRPEALDRFVREAETTGRLEHPAIVDVYDVALSEDGRPYIVMELLSGETIESYLETKGPLSPLRTAALISLVAQGLELAHGAGVIHRDLTCANIFLARNPDGGQPIPKILDFGVSKTLGPLSEGSMRTADGAVLGCPEYMSPEQARGAESVDSRTDIWALGVVLYRCLTGTTPFRGNNYNALMVSILTRPHRPLREVAPMLDPELVAIVEACLEKDRNLRTQTARELADRLGAVARRIAADSVGAIPRRRATDRLGTAGAGDVPLGTLPWPARAVRAARSVGGRSWVVGLLGLAVGLAVGSLASPQAPWSAVEEVRPQAVAQQQSKSGTAAAHPVARGADTTRVSGKSDGVGDSPVAVAKHPETRSSQSAKSP